MPDGDVPDTTGSGVVGDPMVTDQPDIPEPKGYKPNKRSTGNLGYAQVPAVVADPTAIPPVLGRALIPAIVAKDGVAGWYYGIEVPVGSFATVAGMCTPWTQIEKVEVLAARELRKQQELIWAKKNVCYPKRKICAPKALPYAKKSSCGCGY